MGKKDIELEFEDARELFNVLKEVFDKEVITITQPYPVYPYYPDWHWGDSIYVCEGGGTTIT